MMMADTKKGFSFGFAKKAEPKRVVEALAQTTRKKDDRVAILAVESGKVTVDGPTEAEKLPSIPCKNLLEDSRAVRQNQKAASSTDGAPGATAAKPKTASEQAEQQDALPGGLVQRNLSKLSSEDAEAARELLAQATGGAGSGSADGAGGGVPVQPILMREGAKRARLGQEPDAAKDQFDRMPVDNFGMALLRGMGYDPEKNATKPVIHDKVRDHCLGLGAKALLPHEKLAAAKKKAGGAPAAAAAAASSSAGAASSSSSSAAAPALAEALAAPAAAAASDAGARSASSEVWPSRGLVVRIVGNRGQLREFYGAEAVVLEVDASSGACRVKARPVDDPNGKSRVIPGVAMADLETRVSRDCKQVRVVRGKHLGKVARLVARDAKRGVAKVELSGAEAELPLDSVCQFVG
eukprot:TRINITY_DN12682_c0_g1_i1.p1 TRINITY_DN12682_c0_g1~~TRINITY_DN12682_c0_g1_i1.p1  ORF type:complete len:409 (-),score=108.60 TRINITY_DN12682_c0_g1_i1:318-1544(-)